MLRRILLSTVLMFVACSGCGTQHAAPKSTKVDVIEKGAFPHEIFDAVLKKYNRGGFVDYAAVKADRQGLDDYLAALAKASPKTNKDLFPDAKHELAYYINAYNALVFQNVISRYPISDLSSKVTQTSFFYSDDFQMGSGRITLYDLENKIIRPEFNEPRTHFALNCASFGCPRLPEEAFTPEKLEAQLTREANKFVMEDRNVSVKPNKNSITLSMIFNWYKVDFVDHESVKGSSEDEDLRLIKWINQWRPKDKQIPEQAPNGKMWEIKYRDYDWTINDRKAETGNSK